MVLVYEVADATAAQTRVQDVPVSVSGVVIARDAIARETQHHPAETPVAAWREAARALVVRELLLQEAQRLQLVPQPQSDEAGRRETDEEALIRAVIDQAVKAPVADEATCRRYYDRNRSRFCSPDIFEAAHILILAQGEGDDRLVEARRIAMEILAELERHPEAFGEFAAAWSACPSAKTDGNLGQITRGSTTPEFEAALLALSPGETTREPVQTRYGLHIIRLDRHVASGELPFEEVHRQIADYLTECNSRFAIAQYLALLASRAEIVGVDLPAPSDLRVS